MNDNQTLSEFFETSPELKIYCTCCGAELQDMPVNEIFFDSFLFEWFGYLFCNVNCRDNYINSK